MSDVLGNPQAFRKWLQNQPPLTMFRRASACSCPLARYLSGVTGERWEVLPDCYYRIKGDETAVLPDWAKRFVYEFDTYGRGTTSRGDPVECLAVLDKVTS